jgi:hypothetical protein
MLEERRVPEEWRLAKPIVALREVSRDESFRWIVRLADGRSIPSVDLQREYLSLARAYAGESEQTDWVLQEWQSILDGLEKDPLQLGDRIDWVAKRQIVEEYRAAEGLEWDDEALHSVDLEYHNIDPEKSLFHAWQEMGRARRTLAEVDIVDAMTEPPPDTRAKGRSKLVREVLKRKGPRFYVFDWNGVAVDRHRFVEMPDPFETYVD